MSELVVVGAGAMGKATLSILARWLPDQKFRVIDRDPGNLAEAASLAPDRIVGEELDIFAGGLDLAGADMVVNFAGPFYRGADTVARAAVAGECDYVDICDDVEGVAPILALDGGAREAGVTLVTGAGCSPGISNLMGKRLLETQPDCDGIRVVWVVGDEDPGGLAPLRHMLHMSVAPCPVWRNGEFVDEPGFVETTAACYDLPELGPTTVFNTAHSEPATMARAFPDLRYLAVQGALLPEWSNAFFSSIGRIGFGYADAPVEVDGRQVDPIEVLWKVLWARHDRRNPGPRRGGVTVVQSQALRGDEVIATMTMYDPRPMARATSVGAAAICFALLESELPAGAYGPEILDAESTLARVEEIAAEQGAFPGGLREDAVRS